MREDRTKRIEKKRAKRLSRSTGDRGRKRDRRGYWILRCADQVVEQSLAAMRLSFRRAMHPLIAPSKGFDSIGLETSGEETLAR
jgi:hypothetical protein